MLFQGVSVPFQRTQPLLPDQAPLVSLLDRGWSKFSIKVFSNEALSAAPGYPGALKHNPALEPSRAWLSAGGG